MGMRADGASKLTCLHGHKGAPSIGGRAVQQAGDDVAQEEHQIGPVSRDLGGQGLATFGEDGLPLRLGQQRLLLVGAIEAWRRRVMKSVAHVHRAEVCGVRIGL
jgi:hypothetical protein